MSKLDTLIKRRDKLKEDLRMLEGRIASERHKLSPVAVGSVQTSAYDSYLVTGLTYNEYARTFDVLGRRQRKDGSWGNRVVWFMTVKSKEQV